MVDKIESYIISHYSDSDFMDKYKKFIKENYPNPITEPLLGDGHLTELTNGIISGTELAKDSFDYLKQSDIVLDDNDELSHEMLSLARDIPTFSIDTLKETINKYQNLTATNPEYSELYVEIVGPSADELINTLCDEHRAGDLDSVTQDMYPRAFSELYDDDWYQRLKPETIMKLMRERGDDFSGYVNLNKAKKVADNVAGIVTGNRAMNTINKVKNDIHDTIDKYNPSDSGSKVKPQGATGGDYSESENPSDKLIQKMKDKGFENRPPLEDRSNKSIPTGDKPDEHLGGNPNDKSEGNTDMALQKEAVLTGEDSQTGETKKFYTIVDPSAPAIIVDRLIRRYVKDVPNTSNGDASLVVDNILKGAVCRDFGLFNRKAEDAHFTDVGGFDKKSSKTIQDRFKEFGTATDDALSGNSGVIPKLAASTLKNTLTAANRASGVKAFMANPFAAIKDKLTNKAADIGSGGDTASPSTSDSENKSSDPSKSSPLEGGGLAGIMHERHEKKVLAEAEAINARNSKPTDPKPASELEGSNSNTKNPNQSSENIK